MSQSPPPEEDFKIPLLMLAIIIIPAVIAVSRVENAVELLPPDRYASPYGYTWSLTLFLVPVVVLGVWLLCHPLYAIERKSFWGTILLLAPLGFGLDIFLGNSFFTFVNHGATLRLNLLGYDFHLGWRWNIPVEEFAFYLLGFLAVLLIYIWCDLFWVKGYSTDEDRHAQAQATAKLVSIHFPSLWVALGLIGAAVLYKYLGPHPYHQGFPGYFTFLVTGALIPAFVFFPVAKPLVNWRAFSLTLFMVLLISLLWEATLAVPYQWWGYNFNQMMGMVIKPWAALPMEATIVWLVVTWITVIVYEVVRTYFHMGRGVQALLGSGRNAK
jgi:hypothetical protein